MKGIGYSTILLAFVLVVVVISSGLLAYLCYHTYSNPTGKYEDLWKSKKKLILLAPTILNLLSAAVLGVLMMTN